MALSASPTLEFAGVRLEQLDPKHAADLSALVARDGLDQAWFAKTPSAQAMYSEIERRLALQGEGKMAPFAILDLQSNKAVGATTYLNIDAVNRRVEIGSTFLGLAHQGTGINAAAKYLLLQRAFEELDCIAVAFCTHWHNRQSREAIARLGAKQDGVLRNHMYDARTGTLRDTVVFSILPHEWPSVKQGLLARLAKHDRI
ncbi:N-acetyltransferase [Arthrobacter sp. MYb211]|uniref:GNAT family N-acetyltransferase n=1 Tax=Micrococcaceae TaxID=1268 RepID=UPI000CFDEBE2|nr:MULTISPECIES: GNAT family protein [unclassified Arthrobacter]PQZ99607.1 N-acetyltransferase [Arthrobacter sp. MYb224]PRA05927.1 N-acetyltransferase [Arthrobacter sp. MYb229]PRA11300.1 N-acetyltransferase [Arthrobacter sp. MYb221]PRB52828.1 N-acetyltransferase [Arthrobacter sp. MYb216]PRC07525.1 N-acetyltransferase [Arthrobacter sp. MYb211]